MNNNRAKQFKCSRYHKTERIVPISCSNRHLELRSSLFVFVPASVLPQGRNNFIIQGLLCSVQFNQFIYIVDR
jgi:hypothetical protein